MLNILWPAFIIISFVYAIFTGRVTQVNNSIFESTASAVELSITLLGTMCLWNGIMQIASSTTIIDKLIRMLNPILRLLFPDINKEDEANKEISMNIIANMMGLGNAATPAGLRAMQSLQRTNKNKKVLSNSMAIFIVLNTASIQIIPTTVIAIRNALRIKQSNSHDSSCVDCQHLCSSCCSDLCKNTDEKVVDMTAVNYLSNLAIPFTILIILVYGLVEKNKVFDTFLEGAKEGIQIVIKIFPTLIGLFVAIGALRYSGILDFFINLISPVIHILHIPNEVMPLAILRPISRKRISCNWIRYNEDLWD